MSENKDQDILKDEIIQLTSEKPIKKGVSEIKYRLVSVYKADENKVINIISNNLDWSARTIPDLYKKRWDIELFFKAIKQNLLIKSFLGTSENEVKSQTFFSLINYLLLKLIRRVYCKSKTVFSNFCEKIRICLLHYVPFDYLCNHIKKEGTLFDLDKFSYQTELVL